MEETRSPHSSGSTKVFHYASFAMNTRFSMVLVGVDAERAETLAQAAERDLRACELLMSRFDAKSPVFDLNRRFAEEAVEPPAELWRILALCGDDWKRTYGAFDITLWPLNRLWHEQMSRGEEPTQAALQQSLAQTGFHRLRFDESARTVRVDRKGMSLDLGGSARAMRSSGLPKGFGPRACNGPFEFWREFGHRSRLASARPRMAGGRQQYLFPPRANTHVSASGCIALHFRHGAVQCRERAALPRADYSPA